MLWSAWLVSFVCVVLSHIVTQNVVFLHNSKDNSYTLLQVGNNKEIGSYFAVVALTVAIFAAIMLKN